MPPGGEVIMRKLLAALVLLAAADARAAEPDLSVRAAPAPTHVKLRMRAGKKHVAQMGQPAPAATAVAPAPSGDGGGGAGRSLEEHVVFKLQAGYVLDNTPLSGDPMKNGVTPASIPDDGSGASGLPLRSTNGYLLGDAVLGTRGIPTASLSTYFQSQFRLSIDGASLYATRNDQWDQLGDHALLVQSAYGEIDGYGAPGSAIHKLFVRGGRQFHMGAAMFVSHFDGLTLAWQDDNYEVGGFFGRRVALWLGDDPGLMGGANFKLNLKRINGWPVALGADYLNFDGSNHYVELSARAMVRGATVTLTGRALDAGNGFGVGRLGGRIRWPYSRQVLILADGDLVLSHDVAYDWLSPTPTDVVDVASTGKGTALSLPEPGDALRVGLGALYETARGIELSVFGRANLGKSTGFDQTWFEGGVAVRAPLLGNAVTGEVEAKLRHHQLDAGTRDAGSGFDDVSGSGTADFEETSAELRFRMPKKASLAVGGYLRVYDVTTPYAKVESDARAGGRADAELWLERRARVHVIAEAAQPSQTFAPDLSTMYSIRVMGEASF
jgi:hypothetical protein